jgi:hypothetical protein
MGCDGDGMGRHVMGRDGMALSHSNAWPGTVRLYMFKTVFPLILLGLRKVLEELKMHIPF